MDCLVLFDFILKTIALNTTMTDDANNYDSKEQYSVVV